jgi:phosphate transport system substrate-binding protein
MRTKQAFVLLGAVGLLASGCEHGPDGSASAATRELPVRVKGSDTMVNLGQAWAEAFLKSRPELSVAVTGGGSGTGIAALADRTCDIAQCSRPMKAKERDAVRAGGKDPKEIPVATDALVVAVHPENPIASLTFEQLSAIFTGKVTSWKAVGGPDRPIVVLSRERNSGTHVYFLEHVVRRGNEKGPEEYAETALMLPSSQAIVDELATNKGAIGYYGLGYLTPKNKALAVAKENNDKPIAPSVETALDGTYPIARSLFFYVPGEPEGTVRKFIDFVLSDDGQRIVKKLDFVPLRAIKE